DVFAHERTAFRQNLKHMPVGFLHHVKNAINERAIDILVEEIAHRIHEDHAWLLPDKRLLEPRRPEPQTETLLVWMAGNTAPSLGEALGITIVTPAADLGAAGHWPPRRARPLDRSEEHT